MTSVGCASGSIQRRKNSVEKSLQKYIAILSNSRVLLAVEQFNSPITNSLLMLDHLRKKSVVFLSFHCLFFFLVCFVVVVFSRNGFLFSSQYLLSQWLIWQQVTMIVCCFSAFLNTVTAFLSTISMSDIPLNLVLHLIKMSAWNVSFLSRPCSLL